MLLVLILVFVTVMGMWFFGRDRQPVSFGASRSISFRGLHFILLTLFAAGFMLVVFYAVKALPAKSDVTHPESAVIYSAHLSAKTGRLYSSLDSPPYTPVPYGPFFYSSLQVVAKITGSEVEQIRRGYRIFDFACFLAIPFVAFSILRRLNCDMTLAIVGALASGSAFFFHTWNTTARPDVPALLLSVLAIWLICRNENLPVGDIVLSAFICTSALLFKQSYLAAPLSIFLVLIVRRKTTEVAIFCAACLVSASAGIGYYLLRGEPVVRQILLVGKSPIDWKTSLYLVNVYLPTGLGVIVILFGCAGFWLAVSATDWRLKLLGFYFFFSTVIGLVTIMQVGGNCNYFFEMWVGSALLMPFAVAELEQPWKSTSTGLKFAVCAMLLGLFLEQIYSIRQVAKLVRDFETAPLANLHVYSTLSYLTLHGKDPEFLDPFLLTIAEQHHAWSPAPLLEQIETQKFDVMILMEEGRQLYRYRGYDIYSMSTVSAIKNNYVLLCRTGSLVVLRPRSRLVPFSASDSSLVLNERCYTQDDLSY